MDDPQNNLQTNQNHTPQGATDVLPVQPVQQAPAMSLAAPVSGPHKEMAPMPQSPALEHLKPTSESQPELSQELAEIGVEHVADQERPNIPASVQQVGVTHAKEAVPVHTSPHGTVQLLDTPRDELIMKSKTGPVTEAARWLALFLLRQVDKVAYQKVVTKGE